MTCQTTPIRRLSNLEIQTGKEKHEIANQELPRRFPALISFQMAEKQVSISIEESLGARATRIAQEKASQWLDDTWAVIQKTILDTAARGLFHCTLRFVDVVPQGFILSGVSLRKILKINPAC